MKELLPLIYPLMDHQDFDCLSFAIVDFARSRSSFLEIRQRKLYAGPPLIYDLASLTKPLTLALAYFKFFREKFNLEQLLLLNHQASLPAWGRLSADTWRQQILSYPIATAPTLYSDFSALRLMLEMEAREKVKFHDLCVELHGKNVIFWRDLFKTAMISQQRIPVTGTRGGRDICGDVHDDNAFRIGEFCSHAGLFASVEGLATSLLQLDRQGQLLQFLSQQWQELSPQARQSQRFLAGWDRVLDPQSTLAGTGAQLQTVGHLGFTGTSIWIDLQQKKGHIILTNATQKYWYHRERLNHLRRTLGEILWSYSL